MLNRLEHVLFVTGNLKRVLPRGNDTRSLHVLSHVEKGDGAIWSRLRKSETVGREEMKGEQRQRLGPNAASLISAKFSAHEGGARCYSP